MAYEEGLPFHIAGLAMTVVSNFLLPAGIPLSIEFAVLMSDPGSIDAAHNHWLDAAKKLDDFKASLEKAKNLNGDSWTGDDQKAFAHSVNAYEVELETLHQGIEGIAGILEVVAIALYLLCILVMAIGIILIGMFAIAVACLYVPLVGEAIIAEMNSFVGMIVGHVTPTLVSAKAALLSIAGFIATVLGATKGDFEFKQFTAGRGEPNFTQANVAIPQIALPQTTP
jgi:hypothetical protein